MHSIKMETTVNQATKPRSWLFNPMRFMQIALAATVFLSMSYIWQFMARTVVSPTIMETEADGVKDALTKLTQMEEPSIVVHRDRSHAHTLYMVRDFEVAHKFVREYNVETQGPLFILFLSGTNADGVYWYPPCILTRDVVYTGFERAPRGSRLLEIQVGSKTYWNDLMNPFRQNQLFYIDYLPTLMRYDGRGNSSALLAGINCHNQDLLDVVFKVDKPATNGLPKNRVIHYTTATQVMDFFTSYDYSYPLFLYFVSGVHAFNNRLWCPFCDKAEVPIMYYFNYTAPERAVLLRIVVARDPLQWFEEDNDFVGLEFSDKVVEFDGVPYLGFVNKNHSSNKIMVREIAGDLDNRNNNLYNFFQQKVPYTAVVPTAS